MYPTGHYGTALLLAAPVVGLLSSERRDALFVLFVLSASMLPDADAPLPVVGHHGAMHTVLFAVVGSVGVGLAFTAGVALYHRHLVFTEEQFAIADISSRYIFAFSTSAFSVGILSHLVADVLAVPVKENPLRPFWPLSEQVVSVGLIPPASPVWNLGLLVAGLTVQVLILYDVRGVVRGYANEDAE